MPREQGGGTQIWRGLAPWFCATIASRPCAMLANNQVRNISLFQTNQSTPFGEKLVKSVAAGATSGGIVIFALHPLHMASLRLQLDVGGGTLGSRASFKNTKQVLSQIAKQSGVFSTPFSTSGAFTEVLVARVHTPYCIVVYILVCMIRSESLVVALYSLTSLLVLLFQILLIF